MDLKKFLIAVHAGNTDELNNYNVAVIYDENMLEVNVQEIMREKFNCMQKAFWFDTREQKPQGHLLKNSLKPLVIGHWASSGVIDEGCCNLQGENASNVFPCKGISSEPAVIPVELAATLSECSASKASGC